MPVYEYRCPECGEKFEQRRSIFDSGKDKAVCPKCGSADTERVYSPLFCTGSSSGSTCSSTPSRYFG
ncbi:MAG: zinc ribbon domain-containing protein [Chloroflexota bacterium]